jgi:LysM repeat protein
MARIGARLLALIALIAAIAGVYVIVHETLTKKKDTVTQTSSSSTTTTGQSRAQAKAHHEFAKAKYYSVRSGDSLSSIAAKTGVSLGTIESLNPNVDPNALQTGQRLKLRR